MMIFSLLRRFFRWLFGKPTPAVGEGGAASLAGPGYLGASNTATEHPPSEPRYELPLANGSSTGGGSCDEPSAPDMEGPSAITLRPATGEEPRNEPDHCVSDEPDTPIPVAKALPHAGSEQLLHDELERVDFLLKAYLVRQRSAALVRSAVSSTDSIQFPTACAAILGHDFRWSDPVVDEDCQREIERFRGKARAKEQVIVARLRATEERQRIRLTVWRLARSFALIPNLAEAVPETKPHDQPAPPPRNTIALDVLLLALLAARSPRYRAALAGTPTEEGSPASGLTTEMAIQIAQGEDQPEKLCREIFGPKAPLVANRLIELGEDLGPVGVRSIRIDERMADYLTDRDTIDPVIQPFCRLISRRYDWDRLLVDPPVRDSLRQLSEIWWRRRAGKPSPYPGDAQWPHWMITFLHGPVGSPFLHAAAAFLTRKEVGVPKILVIDLPKALTVEDNWENLVRRCYREASLRGAAVFWQGWESLLATGQTPSRWETVVTQSELVEVPIFIASELAWDPVSPPCSSNRLFLRFEFRLPSEQTRRVIWKDRLARIDHPLARDDQPAKKAALDLLESFQFTEGQIDDALAIARGLPLATVPARPLPSEEELFEGCRRVSSRHLVSFAQRVEPRPGFSDLSRVIVPPDVTQQLQELADSMQYLYAVHHRLGFEQRLSLGRGLVALFTGPSGTGKTMAATALAGLNKKDLYKVDLAAVVSKYVGETEKNLNRVFADAQDANAVLFFDEADAMFGKRGEVEQAQDRWANLEVNFLLQKIEEYTGTVILATNLRQNIDDAFLRRVQMLINFPLPNATDRLKILRGMFPRSEKDFGQEPAEPATGKDSPRVISPTDGELKPIADRFELSGGSLKNAVLDAVFRVVSKLGSVDRPIVIKPDDLVLGVARIPEAQ